MNDEVKVAELPKRWRTVKNGLSATGCANELDNALARQEASVSAGDAVFAFASLLTALPHVVPFGSAAWATPAADLASAFNSANGLHVSVNFPDGLKFPKIEGDLLALVEQAAAPPAQVDLINAVRQIEAAWRAVSGYPDTESDRDSIEDAISFASALIDQQAGGAK